VARSHRFLGPIFLTGNDSLLYTVPTGLTAVVKAISIYNHDTVARDFILKTPQTAAPSTIFRRVALAASANETTLTFLVLESGEGLYGRANNAAASTCELVLHGFLVSG